MGFAAAVAWPAVALAVLLVGKAAALPAVGSAGIVPAPEPTALGAATVHVDDTVAKFHSLEELSAMPTAHHEVVFRFPNSNPLASGTSSSTREAIASAFNAAINDSVGADHEHHRVVSSGNHRVTVEAATEDDGTTVVTIGFEADARIDYWGMLTAAQTNEMAANVAGALTSHTEISGEPSPLPSPSPEATDARVSWRTHTPPTPPPTPPPDTPPVPPPVTPPSPPPPHYYDPNAEGVIVTYSANVAFVVDGDVAFWNDDRRLDMIAAFKAALGMEPVANVTLSITGGEAQR